MAELNCGQIVEYLLLAIKNDFITTMDRFNLIGKVLYNHSKPDEKESAFSCWYEISKDVPFVNIEMTSLEELFKLFGENNPYTWNSIHIIIKDMKIEEYEKILEDKGRVFLNEALECCVEVVHANYVRHLLGKTIVATSRKDVYSYDDGSWTQNDGLYFIENFISGPYRNKILCGLDRCLTNLQTVIETMKDKKSDDYDRLVSTLTAGRKRYGILSVKLGSLNFCTSISKLVVNKIMDKKADEVFDSNVYLTGVENGIVEVLDSNISLRENFLEDFVSKNTKTPLNLEMEGTYKYEDFLEWLHKLFPKKDTLHFFSKWLGSFFVGKNVDKLFFSMCGQGNNGKSCFGSCIENAWGEYSLKADTTILTSSKKSSTGPSDEIFVLSGPRITIFDEPPGYSYIENGPFKRWTGNDTFSARKCFGHTKVLKPTTKMCMNMNTVTPFKEYDNGIKIRFFVIPWKTRWENADLCPKTKEEQEEERIYPIDSSFINKVEEFGECLLYYSFSYYQKWYEERLENKPAEVKDATDLYWKENDVYIRFVDTELVKTESKEDYITFKELFAEFNLYCHKYNIPKPDSKEALKRFKSLMCTPIDKNQKFKGYKFETEDEGSQQQNVDNVDNFAGMKKAVSVNKPKPLQLTKIDPVGSKETTDLSCLV